MSFQQNIFNIFLTDSMNLFNILTELGLIPRYENTNADLYQVSFKLQNNKQVTIKSHEKEIEIWSMNNRFHLFVARNELLQEKSIESTDFSCNNSFRATNR